MISITAIPAFTDNYIWALHDERNAWIVDPGDAAPVQSFVARLGLAVQGIFITHHHADHTGGLPELVRLHHPHVAGTAFEDIPGIDEPLAEGDRVAALGIDFLVIEVPGHTRGHIALYGEPAGQAPVLFCGDTLFAGGCGRLFEGTPAQMWSSLSKLSALPGNTRVYCAHEYTLSNLKFARAVEPGNTALAEREQRDKATRANHQPTVPSTIALERATNPFLRAEEATVRAAAEHHAGKTLSGTVDVFATIRAWKNDFR